MFSSPENLKSPAWNTGQKNFRKIAPKHVQNTFGLFWERFLALLEFGNFFGFFENYGSLDHPWNAGRNFFLGKNAPKHVQSKFGHFCEQFWAFLDFWNFSKTRTSMEHWANFFLRNWPQNMFGHLRTILDNFRTLKSSWFFSWIFSEYLPRYLSPENRTHSFKFGNLNS